MITKLEKIAFYSILAVVFLVPIIFLSPTILSLEVLKFGIFTIGTSLAFLLVILAAFFSGKITYHKGPLVYAGVGVFLSFVFSALALFGSGFYKSFLGAGTEVTTVMFALTSILFVFTLVHTSGTKEKVVTLLSSFFVGSIFVGLFHAIRFIFGPDSLSFGGLFSSQVSNFIGQWNDLGAYFGFVILLAYIALEFMTLSKIVKVILYVITVVSIALMSIVGFPTVATALAITSACIGIYTWKHRREARTIGGKISYLTAFIFIFTLAFSIFSAKISPVIATKLGVSQLDVRPSWELSVDIATQSLKESPIFGAGPNRYVNQYLKHKPSSINQTVFWSLDFTSGISYITSFVVMLGGFGSIMLLLFFIVFGWTLFKVLRTPQIDHTETFILIAGSAGTLYSLIIGFLYTPAFAIILLGLTCFSLLIVGLKNHNLVKTVQCSSTNPRGILVRKIGFAIIAILTFVLFVFFVKKVVAGYYFQQALVSFNKKEDLTVADMYIEKALGLDKKELYYQAIAEINIIKINQLVSNTKNADEKTIATLKGYLEKAVNSSQSAIRLDPLNYQNYITQARVYESVVPAQVTGAYENATKSYASASSLNPQGPAIFLAAAQLEVSMKKLADAKKFIGLALQTKNNYSEAIFLLSQIQVSENSIKDAITSLLVLAQINPNDATIFFQLGLLYYNQNDNVNTVIALSRAVEINPQYSNARYFLGLALARLNKFGDAAAQFVELEKFNPDNVEVKQILASLNAGRSPFQTAKPIVTKPETRKKLPVRDAIDKKVSPQIETR